MSTKPKAAQAAQRKIMYHDNTVSMDNLPTIEQLIQAAPTKKKRTTPATALTKEIVEFCYEFDHCRVKRCNTIGVPLPGGGFRPSPQTGWPDLFLFIDSTESCLYPRTICIEIKASKGDKQRDSQIEFERDVTAVGVEYYIIRSFAEFEKLWKELN